MDADAIVDPKDVKVEVMRARGAGGQVNIYQWPQPCLRLIPAIACQPDGVGGAANP